MGAPGSRLPPPGETVQRNFLGKEAIAMTIFFIASSPASLSSCLCVIDILEGSSSCAVNDGRLLLVYWCTGVANGFLGGFLR